jgi:hypothetical protein
MEVHICNLSYSGVGDQEDHSSKPAEGKIVTETASQQVRCVGTQL